MIRALLYGALALAAIAGPIGAQCTFPPGASGQQLQHLSFVFVPTISPTSSRLHVALEFDGGPGGEDVIELPAHWAGQGLHALSNLRAVSANATIAVGGSPETRVVRHPAGQRVRLEYDLEKDWAGPLVAPLQFHPVVMPTYLEINGDNGLVRPHMSGFTQVVATFDWRALPASWALATSFGASAVSNGRCQRYVGQWRGVRDALFAAGDFRIHEFKIGAQPAVLAIRGPWTFTDDEVIADIQRVVGVVRDFWHDDRFPYFLVTWTPYDQDHGSSDGSGFTNAFWMYMSRLDSLSTQLTQLSHEAFHAWNPRRMGELSEAPGENVDWFHEGFTTYYADLLVYRAGLMPLETLVSNSNRDLRSFAGSTSPYIRGRDIALWLDGTIRRESNDARSLDDLMRAMIDTGSVTLTQTRILETAGRYLSPAAQRQLANVVRQGSTMPPLADAVLGPCVHLANDSIRPFDLGFDLAASRAAHVIVGVRTDGPAYAAGLRDGQPLGRVSLYNGQADMPARFWVQIDGAEKTIEYYPRGRPTFVPQYHLDRQAYAANPEACRTG